MARNVYVIGDIHGDYNIIDARFGELKNHSLEKKDVLFVAGDAGFINSYEKSESKNDRILHLNSLPFIIIVVLGNHENYDVIEALPETTIFGGKCYKEEDVDVYYAKNGQIFNIDGKRFFTFNGGLSIDKEKRLKMQQEYGIKFWWPQEIKEEDFDAAFKKYISHHVDYVITHDVPLKVFNQLTTFIPGRFKDQVCPLQHFFQKLHNLSKFKMWYAAHYHPSYQVTIDKVVVLPIGHVVQVI